MTETGLWFTDKLKRKYSYICSYIIFIFVICSAEDDLPAGVRGGCVHVFLVSAQFPECFDGPGHSGSFVQVHQHNTTLTTIYTK